MATGSMETALMSDPTAKLPDDLLVEIISRVPYKSTRCCKCVSTRWRDLIAHPDHREKLPRSTLAGFFYKIYDLKRRPPDSHGYLSVSGTGAPLTPPSRSCQNARRLIYWTAATASSSVDVPSLILKNRITWCAILPLRNG
ncbi:uncharacterized protein [Triticum aestivum]|uniref:uncharacterized protein n=1 Tax=Triticum aestivum TaxID=4565 RepID=UPI001D017EA5|nr:uncharacterized protein LOC123066351 [Triticum aestivum]